MGNTVLIPSWLTVVAWLSLLLSFVSFIYVLRDVLKHPQPMKVMNEVWPLTTLFGSIVWVKAYKKWGKPKAIAAQKMEKGRDMKMGMASSSTNKNQMEMSDMKESSMPVSVFIGTCHCGAGCTLADLIIEWLLFFMPGLYVVGGYPWLFKDNLFAGFVLAFILAYIIGVSFQYFAIVPMKHLGKKEGIIAAIKADTLSLTSWQIGMYAIVSICQLWLFPLWFGGRIEANTPVFWLMMQVAMLAGFCTAYPMNWFLIKTGIKERM
ncbi:DUF4396 domain-containing protein [Vagococcus jeotgali]|uniref:DUF4396 domain-containing protein n=1 Tax=Vagococcus jeotgali TaxID=3109030 RepID=UPI002DD89D1D|nr:DUF4396 domain-containing protein [Vagococcus sp. B2T-5]